MDLQMVAKMDSSTVGKGGNRTSALLNLFIYIYRRELFCIALSYLQLTELQNSSKAMKGRQLPHTCIR